MEKNRILLISFYNNKAMGIRCLEKALVTAGFDVYIVFFKKFNSVKPKMCTEKELNLLTDLIGMIDPMLIGLSVMSTFYLEAVLKVNQVITNNYDIPVVWGGVYPSLFPEDCLKFSDYVIVGEGEHALIEFANAIRDKQKIHNIQNVGYRFNDDVRINELRHLSKDPDEFGPPIIGGDNKFSIENDRIFFGDPQLLSMSYETAATKGCPFACSFCSSINLRRLYKGKGEYLRYRSVESVINELIEAKEKIKNLKYIRFWDEIFSDNEDWVERFCESYVEHINLPFEIWCHPLKVKKSIIRRLTAAGLYKAVMGIQSGSERILKDVFRRYESTNDILKACNILHECKVPEIVYDFILLHPFETEGDLIETYELVRRIPRPFSLQIHGLNFLPGTDIVKIALERKVVDFDKLNKIMYGTMEEQYSHYWGLENRNSRSNFWLHLIHLSQFNGFGSIIDYLAVRSNKALAVDMASLLYKVSTKLVRFRHLTKKAGMIATSTIQQTVLERRRKFKVKKALTN
ncbi:MAG: B12-binding domain-containing radical SAM protein [Clostridia bacterium]|jgi:anaerobic magnesium-protoporphyrin IX monomethyl ester cyclase|nr:B12-binding domain-containing radical SAM protein [Clostridiaceae bacterium]